MCGIAGVMRGTGDRGDLASIEAMTAELSHRGPDAGATLIDTEAGIALGHRRLAVIELSELGAQPMRSADGRFTIVFNGEIYNHLDLRHQLESVVHVAWRGTSDTETLVECISMWGVEKTLKRSVGMFALALWDHAERRLILARDRYGEKPLYYGYVGRGAATTLVFGSELKALRAHRGFDNAIDREAVALFLQYSYVPAPLSIYQWVFKLEPGSMISVTAEDIDARRSHVERYWRYVDVVTAGLADPFSDEGDAIDALERVISDAVGLQLAADVPVGAFLSGGIDSSTIVALMQARSSRTVKTFTVGFDEIGFDEAPHAKEVARHLGTEHCEIRVTPSEARAVIPNLPLMYDEPFGDSSQIPTSIVCAMARREVTVALSGDAGDEILGGYNRYVIGPQLWKLLSRTSPALRGLIGEASARAPNWGWAALGRAPGLGNKVAPFATKAYKFETALRDMRDPDDLYRALVTEWAASDAPVVGGASASAALSNPVPSALVEPAQRMMFLDALTFLPDDILVKVDRAAMAVGLETRVPLLDHRVAEVAWRLPLSMKIRQGQGKWALRQILYRHVPRDLVERPKAGFAIPVGQWLREPLRDWADELLSESLLKEQGYLNVAAIRRLWLEHRSGARDWTPRLWNVLMFQSWLSYQNTGRALDVSGSIAKTA